MTTIISMQSIDNLKTKLSETSSFSEALELSVGALHIAFWSGPHELVVVVFESLMRHAETFDHYFEIYTRAHVRNYTRERQLALLKMQKLGTLEEWLRVGRSGYIDYLIVLEQIERLYRNISNTTRP